MAGHSLESMKWPAYPPFGAATLTAAIALLALSNVDPNIRRWIVFIAVPQ